MDAEGGEVRGCGVLRNACELSFCLDAGKALGFLEIACSLRLLVFLFLLGWACGFSWGVYWVEDWIVGF